MCYVGANKSMCRLEVSNEMGLDIAIWGTQTSGVDRFAIASSIRKDVKYKRQPVKSVTIKVQRNFRSVFVPTTLDCTFNPVAISFIIIVITRPSVLEESPACACWWRVVIVHRLQLLNRQIPLPGATMTETGLVMCPETEP